MVVVALLAVVVGQAFLANGQVKLASLQHDLSVEQSAHRQAEVFYLQKQIQSHTPMVIVLEDGEHVEGCIEWYDRNSLKVRGLSLIHIWNARTDAQP